MAQALPIDDIDDNMGGAWPQLNLNMNANANYDHNHNHNQEIEEPTTPHDKPIVMPPGILNAPKKAEAERGAGLHSDNTM